MNILILPSWYTTPENPISGIFFKEQSIALQNKFKQKDNNDKVFIAYVEEFSIINLKTYLKRKKYVITVEDEITTIRTSFLRIPKMHTLNFYLGANAVKKAIKRFSKKINTNFDLVHIHSALNAGIWYSLSRQKIPYVITEHSTKFSRGVVTASQKKMLFKAFDDSLHIIAVGNGLVHEIGKYTRKPVEVIFNIVVPLFSNFDILQSTNDVFTFFSLGVNARKKGFDILLSAFSNYILKGYKGRLIIAGVTDIEKEWLCSLGFVSEVLSNVVLLEKIDRQTVFSYLTMCDCFVLVSRYETFGVVFAEAMYCGKPVIATRTGGPDSFVNEINGLLVDVESMEATTEALIYMVSNISKYDSESIKQFAKKNFSPDLVCEKLYDIYTSILCK